MTRARAAWIAATVVVLAAVGYLVRRRMAAATPAPARTPAAPLVTAAAVGGTPTREVAVISDPPLIEEEPPVLTEVRDVVEDAEQPLPTWARVAIVAVSLLAFFAVSLIATKRV